jgi:hypothetical protein
VNVKIDGMLQSIITHENTALSNLMHPQQHTKSFLGPLNQFFGTIYRCTLGRLTSIIFSIIETLQTVDDNKNLLALLTLLLKFAGMCDNVRNEEIVGDHETVAQSKPFAGHRHLIFAFFETVIKNGVTLLRQCIGNSAHHRGLTHTRVTGQHSRNRRRKAAAEQTIHPIKAGRNLFTQLGRHLNRIDIRATRQLSIKIQQLHFLSVRCREMNLSYLNLERSEPFREKLQTKTRGYDNQQFACHQKW